MEKKNLFYIRLKARVESFRPLAMKRGERRCERAVLRTYLCTVCNFSPTEIQLYRDTNIKVYLLRTDLKYSTYREGG